MSKKFIGGRMSGKSYFDDELTPLEAFGNIAKSTRLTNLFAYYEKELDIIETALKEKETQDSILRTLKEIIKFSITLPYIGPNRDNVFDIMSAVGINIQRDIENRERKLLRKWVLETCFPKELKALEIIKRYPVEVISCWDTYSDWEEYRKDYYNKAERKGLIETKEEFDLLKEELK